ncbi:Elongation factor 2, partial [Ascosphaera pollenicola]
LGKKKVKAIAKALRALETTSFPSSNLPALNNTPRSLYPYTPSQSNISPRQTSQQQQQQQQQGQPQDQSLGVGPFEDTLSHLPIGIPERTPLCSPATKPRPGSYGSIIASPPDEHDDSLENLQLPDPAMTPHTLGTPKEWNSPSCGSSAELRRSSVPNVEGSGKDPRKQGAQGSGNGGARGMLSSWTPTFRGTPGRDSMRRASINRLQRVFSHADRGQSSGNDTSTPEAYKEFEARELDFVSFLDSELAKIEEFYKQLKEGFRLLPT